MANYYTETSSSICIGDGQEGKAQDIVDWVVKECEADEDWGQCGVCVEVRPGSVWLYSEESVCLDHIELMARSLIEGLEIDERVVISWSESCDKARLNAFTGGAMVLRRGYPTVWVNACHEAQVKAAGMFLQEDNKKKMDRTLDRWKEEKGINE